MNEGSRSEVVCMSCGATGDVAAKDEPMPTFGAAGETVEADGVYTGRGPGKPPGRWRALPALVWLCERCAAALDASFDDGEAERAG